MIKRLQEVLLYFVWASVFRAVIVPCSSDAFWVSVARVEFWTCAFNLNKRFSFCYLCLCFDPWIWVLNLQILTWIYTEARLGSFLSSNSSKKIYFQKCYGISLKKVELMWNVHKMQWKINSCVNFSSRKKQCLNNLYILKIWDIAEGGLSNNMSHWAIRQILLEIQPNTNRKPLWQAKIQSLSLQRIIALRH